jgi:hypothetical protein
MLDLARMQRIAINSHALAASQAFGAAGLDALRELTDAVRGIYHKIDPSLRENPLIVFMRVQGAAPGALPAPPPTHQLMDATYINHELDSACVVEVELSGRLLVYPFDSPLTAALSQAALVYEYDNKAERFWIGGQPFTIVNPSRLHSSVFANPTFSTLNEALENYRTTAVRYTSCYLLEDIWSDKNRLFLKAVPEATIRRSLHQHLRIHFGRDAEVRPEQNVDETHPVDLKVTWADTSLRALIEIKWLGQSRNPDGTLATGYTQSRALSGASQLANYMDADNTSAPGLTTRGYLVVFDARRKGLTETTVAISAASGLHYRDKEIPYDPKFHETRDDFEVPVRMFAEPVCN